MIVLRKDNGTVVFEKEGATGVEKNPALVVLTIQPGCRIASHTLPVQATFFVVRGTGVLTFSGENVTLSAGDLVTVEPGVNRAWYNPGGELLEVLVIKAMSRKNMITR